MPRWIKFVALFLLVFTVFDIATPEACADDVLAASQDAIQIHGNLTSPDRGSACQFEEDCIACAHILPGTQVELQVVTTVATYDPDLLLVCLDGIPSIPYHPPRA
jgi:hypothetical protein